jgi:hypothetical protein
MCFSRSSGFRASAADPRRPRKFPSRDHRVKISLDLYVSPTTKVTPSTLHRGRPSGQLSRDPVSFPTWAGHMLGEAAHLRIRFIRQHEDQDRVECRIVRMPAILQRVPGSAADTNIRVPEQTVERLPDRLDPPADVAGAEELRRDQPFLRVIASGLGEQLLDLLAADARLADTASRFLVFIQTQRLAHCSHL